MFFTKKEKEKYEQEISNLKHEIKDLTNIVKTQELLRLRAENERLKEKEKLISNIKFKLKDIGYIAEERAILIKYLIPNVKIYLDPDNKPIKNDFFYSINKLQLIPLEDMKKIQNLLDDLEKNIEK